MFSDVPLDYMFDGFPKNVQYSNVNIRMTNLNSTSLSFLSNVACAPINLVITNNSQLQTLSGLNAWPPGPGVPGESGILTTVSVVSNPFLNRTGFEPLGSLLQCINGSSPFNSTFQADGTFQVVPAECGGIVSLNTTNSFCSYLLNGCPSGGKSSLLKRLPSAALLSPSGPVQASRRELWASTWSPSGSGAAG
jgi:hypothetical protein